MDESFLGDSRGGGDGGEDWTVALSRRHTMQLRCAELICAIVVFATLADGGKQSGTSVIGPDHDDPLNFGIAVGVMMFLAALALMVGEGMAVVQHWQADMARQLYAVDIALSALLTVLGFSNFCYMANEWRKTDKTGIHTFNKNSVNASLAFAFFSILLWLGSSILAYRNLKPNGSARYRSAGAPFETDDAAYASFVDEPPQRS